MKRSTVIFLLGGVGLGLAAVNIILAVHNDRMRHQLHQDAAFKTPQAQAWEKFADGLLELHQLGYSNIAIVQLTTNALTAVLERNGEKEVKGFIGILQPHEGVMLEVPLPMPTEPKQTNRIEL
jgi:hypothetical protein